MQEHQVGSTPAQPTVREEMVCASGGSWAFGTVLTVGVDVGSTAMLSSVREPHPKPCGRETTRE